MMNKHPNDLAIQNYLWDRSAMNADDLLHIRSCEHCMTRVEDYKLLFKAVDQIPKPAFDFDLAALVIPKIELAASSEQSVSNRPAPAASPEPLSVNIIPGTDKIANETTGLNNKKSAALGWPAIAAMVSLLLVTGIPVYLFRDELLEIASNASFMITWLIVIMVALIAVFLGIDEYRKYSQRINSLDIN